MGWLRRASLPKTARRLPASLPLLAVRSFVLFPGSVVPISVGRERSLEAVDAARRSRERLIAVVTQRSAAVEDPDWTDLFAVGTAAYILNVTPHPDGHRSVVMQGLMRVAVEPGDPNQPHREVRVRRLGDETDRATELAHDVAALREIAAEARALGILVNDWDTFGATAEPAALADLVAALSVIPTESKQMVLEAVDVRERLRLCTVLVTEVCRAQRGTARSS